MAPTNADLKRIEDEFRGLIAESNKKIDDAISELKNLILGLQTNSNATTSFGNILHETLNSNHHQETVVPAANYPRMEFPQFNGDDMVGWVYKCEQYFLLEATPPELKVRVASVYLEGKASQWHRLFMKSRIPNDALKWEEYIKAMNCRFGPNAFEDPMFDLTNLKQEGSIQEYMDEFEMLLGRVELPEDYAISCFLTGLNPEIQSTVRLLQPTSLHQAYALARLRETSLSNPLKPPPKPNIITNSQTQL